MATEDNAVNTEDRVASVTIPSLISAIKGASVNNDEAKVAVSKDEQNSFTNKIATLTAELMTERDHIYMYSEK